MARCAAVRVGCAAVPKHLDRAEPDRRRQPRAFGAGTLRLARPLAVLLLTAALVLTTGSARAEQLDLGLFLSPTGRAATLRIEDPAPDRHGTFRLGLTLDYAHGLIDRGLACGSDDDSRGCESDARTRALVSDLSRADFFASV